MSGKVLVLIGVTFAFGALTTKALMESGVQGIFAVAFGSWPGAQIFFDLVIVGILACICIWQDAPRRGLPAWPFVLLTLAAGSFGPLIYLIVRERYPARE